MNRYLKIISIVLIPVLVTFMFIPIFAQGEKMGYTTYYFSDSGDNSVVTSSFNLAKRILGRTFFLLDIEVDNVTVPAITAVTGATRPQRQSNKPFKKTRGQVILGIEQGLDATTTIALSGYRSQEVDYVSTSVIGTISKDMFQKNTTLTLRGQYIDDQVGKIEDDGTITNEPKYSGWAAVSLSQLLSPTTVLDLSYDALYLEGFLSDPYRQVRVFDANNTFTIVDEKHPDQRTRQAATGRLKHFFTPIQAAVETSYRYYFDDWGVTSHTGEVQFNKYVFRDFIMMFNYRYYTQTGADFYFEKYVGGEYQNDGFRTADYKLTPFNSNNFGISLTYLLRGLSNSQAMEFLQNSSVELRYFRYYNNLEFSANIWQLNINFSI
jgi:Protein of unknown function (DUF3570)